MTSGIPDYANTGLVLDDVVADPAACGRPTRSSTWCSRHCRSNPPGTLGYSSTNYLILGEMLEKIEGVPIDVILTSVATAAGLTDTALTPGSDNAMPAPVLARLPRPAGAWTSSKSSESREPHRKTSPSGASRTVAPRRDVLDDRRSRRVDRRRDGHEPAHVGHGGAAARVNAVSGRGQRRLRPRHRRLRPTAGSATAVRSSAGRHSPCTTPTRATPWW